MKPGDGPPAFSHPKPNKSFWFDSASAGYVEIPGPGFPEMSLQKIERLAPEVCALPAQPIDPPTIASSTAANPAAATIGITVRLIRSGRGFDKEG